MRPGSQSNACLWSAANVMTPPLTSVHNCTGWQSQGSAWKRYVAQAADAVGSPKTPPLLFAAPTHAPAEQAQPKVAITPEPPCGQPGGQAARELGHACPSAERTSHTFIAAACAAEPGAAARAEALLDKSHSCRCRSAPRMQLSRRLLAARLGLLLLSPANPRLAWCCPMSACIRAVV